MILALIPSMYKPYLPLLLKLNPVRLIFVPKRRSPSFLLFVNVLSLVMAALFPWISIPWLLLLLAVLPEMIAPSLYINNPVLPLFEKVLFVILALIPSRYIPYLPLKVAVFPEINGLGPFTRIPSLPFPVTLFPDIVRLFPAMLIPICPLL